MSMIVCILKAFIIACAQSETTLKDCLNTGGCGDSIAP